MINYFEMIRMNQLAASLPKILKWRYKNISRVDYQKDMNFFLLQAIKAFVDSHDYYVFDISSSYLVKEENKKLLSFFSPHNKDMVIKTINYLEANEKALHKALVINYIKRLRKISNFADRLIAHKRLKESVFGEYCARTQIGRAHV